MTAYTKMNTYLYQWFLVCFVEKKLVALFTFINLLWYCHADLKSNCNYGNKQAGNGGWQN